MNSFHKLSLAQSTMLPCLPGVSYLPDKIEIETGDHLVAHVVNEFLDFLKSLTHLMKLMHTIKCKHLRSLKPVPPAVLREIMTLDNTGPLFKAWDKTCSGNIPGLTMSVDNIFRSGISSGHVNSTQRPRPVYRNRDQQKKRKGGLDNDLIEITGKKTRPLWHVVGLEPPQPTQKPLNQKENARYHQEDQFAFASLLNRKNRPISRTKSNQLLVNINAVKETCVRPSHPDFQSQMDMLLAREAGFMSVADYKAFLDTLKPHWYKDAVMEAYKIDILYNREVVTAFEDLGRYYEVTSTSINHAKAKLAFLVVSMPVWDVCQSAMQRALDYFLHIILEIPPENNTLAEWLRTRKLPYLVEAPVSTEMNFLSQQATRESDNGMEG